jgi:hypothetical protein
LAEQVLAEQAGLVHLADVRDDPLARELPHGGLKHPFFLVERGERERAGHSVASCEPVYNHGHSLRNCNRGLNPAFEAPALSAGSRHALRAAFSSAVLVGVALKIRAKSLKLHRRDDGEQKAKAENIGAGHFHPSGWPACRP